jgi:hypothetical protein
MIWFRTGRHEQTRMPKITYLVALVGIACSRTDARSVAPPESRQIIGTWRALDYVDPRSTDSVTRFPFGRPPTAYLAYTNTGHVFFQLMKDRAATGDRRSRWREADSTSLVRILSEADAYVGTYRIDPNGRTVMHRIEAEIPPTQAVMEVAKPFRISGDTLVIGRDSSVHWVFLRVRPTVTP